MCGIDHQNHPNPTVECSQQLVLMKEKEENHETLQKSREDKIRILEEKRGKIDTVRGEGGK